MRQVRLNGKHDERNSALWGTGSRGGDPRAARPGLRLAVVAASLAAIIVFPATAAAKNLSAYVPQTLMANAQANPAASFDVIVQGRPGQNSASVAKDFGGAAGKLKRAFYSISGVAGSLTGAQLVKLATNNHVLAITPDVQLASSDYSSQEVWRNTTGVSSLWGTPNPLGLLVAPQAPTIAIVDSGIDSSKLADFGTRVVAHVDFCSLCPAGQSGDLEGHGTMVAGARSRQRSLPGRRAEREPRRPAHDPRRRRVAHERRARRDRLDPAEQGQYGIKVANFSMRSATPVDLPLRPAGQGRREPLVQRCGRRRGSRQLRRREHAAGDALRAGQRSVRDHGRRDPDAEHHHGARRHGRSVLGVRLTPMTASRSRRSRLPAG